MRSYWKQFAGWVTRLKDDQFVSARLKLTLLFTSVAIIVLGVLYFTGGVVSLFFLTSLVIILIIATYIIGGQALSPIRNVLRAQKRFIADSSHELRTPLSIMKTNSEVALMGNPKENPEELAEALKSNLEELDRMSKIIEHLLALSFYENKFINIPSNRVDLAEVVKDIVEKTRSLALKKSVSLEISTTEPAPVLINPTALEQLVMNLVKNAIVYTPSGGKVKVSVARNGNNFVELWVKDTGIGIAPEDLPHIFNPFYKTASSKKLTSGASGLGLTIVKKIVERYNGSITIQSELGRGTQVSVFLPAIS